ncbi:MAG: OmpA family protein [Proteobacteria bacterium]|nr:OmpA family protein [Pseudomonadota bacterium]
MGDIRLRVLVGLALAAPLSLSAALLAPAYAQADAAPVSFDIPAQPMANALNSWAVQANLQVFFEEGPVRGLSAPAVSGTMLPTQALKALLANSRLVYTQNAQGAFVVRPRPVSVARAAPAPAAAPVAAPPAAPPPTPPPPRSARDAEGPWVLRLRANYLEPRDRSDAFGLPPGVVPADQTRTNGTFGADLDLEYYFSSRWSTELALNVPRNHDLRIEGATVGTFRWMPNYLTVKYGFNPEGTLRPYLGAGLGVSSFYDFSHANGGLGLTRTSGGPALQAGLDIRLGEHWLVNADLKWARVRAAVSVNDVASGQMHLDPLLYGIGVGYRFGGTPAPALVLPLAAAAPAAPVDPDSDGDGVPDSRDRCPDTPRGVAVDADGCPLDSDHDGVPDYLDKCPGTPPNVKVDAEGCEVEEVVLRGVTFANNSAQLTPESLPILDGVLAVLRERPNAHAEIRGYTDARGADAYNLALSQRRAAAVVDYLAAHGIPREHLAATGLGKASPVATNDTAAGRAENRRVTVQFSRPVPR